MAFFAHFLSRTPHSGGRGSRCAPQGGVLGPRHRGVPSNYLRIAVPLVGDATVDAPSPQAPAPRREAAPSNWLAVLEASAPFAVQRAAATSLVPPRQSSDVRVARAAGPADGLTSSRDCFAVVAGRTLRSGGPVHAACAAAHVPFAFYDVVVGYEFTADAAQMRQVQPLRWPCPHRWRRRIHVHLSPSLRPWRLWCTALALERGEQAAPPSRRGKRPLVDSSGPLAPWTAVGVL